MSLTTPSKIRELQIKLYPKAKNEPGFRFYQLYDKVYREDILNHAYALARANNGDPGVDGERFQDIESRGREEWMKGLREDLRNKTYQPQPVRRAMIPKAGGGERPLSKYFDTIPHSELMQCVARRIVDRQMLHLIKMWLKAPVEERDETTGKRRLTGGKDQDRGTPQGGVVSPGLANLYMNRMLKGWRQTRRGEKLGAQIVNYADDFVILSRGKAKEALDWTRSVLERLKLTLNDKKTSLRNAWREHFDFLGYTFGPHYRMRTGRRYLGYSPSKKSVARIKEKVGNHLAPSN